MAENPTTPTQTMSQGPSSQNAFYLARGEAEQAVSRELDRIADTGAFHPIQSFIDLMRESSSLDTQSHGSALAKLLDDALRRLAVHGAGYENEADLYSSVVAVAQEHRESTTPVATQGA